MDLQKAEVGLQDAGNVPKELAETVWYFAYRHDMVWPSLKEGRKAVAKNVWLSFDFRGIPYCEPALASCIIKGINDQGWRATPGLDDEEKHERYLHDRCCPGVPFKKGYQLPHLEGLLFRISPKKLKEIASFEGSWGYSVSEMGYELRTIQAETYLQDFEEDERKPVQCSAYILAAKEAARQPYLIPSMRCWRSLLRPAYHQVLSQPFISQFFVIRPYAETRGKKIAAMLMRMLYGPAFLLSYATRDGPTLLMHVTRSVLFATHRLALMMERVLRPLVGSGFDHS